MSFAEAVTIVLRHKYATFSGRARRCEYWWFYLAELLAIGVVWIVLGLIAYLTEGSEAVGGIAGLAILVIYLALLVPSTAVLVRRLHDTGRTGWWFWISLLPFGVLVLLVFLVLDSEPGSNRYGPNPKRRGW